MYFFSIVCAIWVFSEVTLLFFVRSRKNSIDQDKGSVVWLNATIYVCVTLGVCAGVFGIGLIRHTFSVVLFWIGMGLIILGIIIRWTAILTLKKYFTTKVVIQSDHRIIQTGIYKFVRHPSYAGSIISFLGLGLAYSNWLSVSLLLVPITVAFIKRIRIEERVLEQAFGDEYVNYRNATWYLLPGVY